MVGGLRDGFDAMFFTYVFVMFSWIFVLNGFWTCGCLMLASLELAPCVGWFGDLLCFPGCLLGSLGFV